MITILSIYLLSYQNLLILRAKYFVSTSTSNGHKALMSSYKKIVVKIGSNVLTNAEGGLDYALLSHLVEQIVAIKQQGIEVVLVSSGAVASGRGLGISLPDHLDDIALRQIHAATGQIVLIREYSELFLANGAHCAQILVTKEDFRDRTHYLNMRHCFQNLLASGIVPIVNENDVVSVTELMFTDNDELAALISTMLATDALIILTNVDGVYDGPPAQGSKIITTIHQHNADLSNYIQASKSSFGRGGMLTKSNMALKVAKNGIFVHIANGKTPNNLKNLALQTSSGIGTTFVPFKETSSNKKQIAFADSFAKGRLYINAGAKEALLHSKKATSLLPVGIVKIEGEFKKGDIVSIYDEQHHIIGLGRAAYASAKALEIIGKKNQKALIHYDYLYLH